MAELFSLGVFRVFRDRQRALMTAEDWEQNHEDAVVFAWTSIFMHSGLPKEIATQKAQAELQKLKERTRQEGMNGTHTYP